MTSLLNGRNWWSLLRSTRPISLKLLEITKKQPSSVKDFLWIRKYFAPTSLILCQIFFPSCLLFSRWDTQYFQMSMQVGPWLTWVSRSYLVIGFELHLQSLHRSAITSPGWISMVRCFDLSRVCRHSGGEKYTSHLPAEIHTKTGTLTLNAVAAINQAQFVSHAGEVIDLLSRLVVMSCKKRRKPWLMP